MGMPDFYLNIKFSNINRDDYELIIKSFADESLFRILNIDSQLKLLLVECKFDNLIPSVILLFNNLCCFKDNICSIETYGVEKEDMFDDINDFLLFVFSTNKDKLLAYYEQMGYFYVDSKKYYRARRKLTKYYKKM